MEHSKTDQYRDGAWIVISRTGTSLCPVKNLELYVKRSNFRDTDFLFCNSSATSWDFKPRRANKALSYSSLRDFFKAPLKPHVENIDDYCLHSLRAGGASAAANYGIKDRCMDAGLVIQQKIILKVI